MGNKKEKRRFEDLNPLRMNEVSFARLTQDMP